MASIETRAAWGARSPKNVSHIASTRGVKAHYTGGHVDSATLTDHAKCRAMIRGFQNQHMDNNGWADLAYSMWVCEHTAGIGRGPGVLTAANGPGLNSGHYSILFLVGNSGVTKATDAMKRHFHQARDYLRAKGGAGAEIKGHRDGYSTDCPGPDIYAWVRAGAPLPAGKPDPSPATPPAPTPSRKDDAYMDYGSFELTTATAITGNAWVPVPWDKENADPYSAHSGTGESIITTPEGPADYTLEAGVELTGVPAGTPVSLRASEYVYVPATKDSPAVDKLVEAGWEHTVPLPESGRVQFGAVGHVQKGRKLRVEVMVHAGGEGYAVKAAAVKYLAQR